MNFPFAKSLNIALLKGSIFKKKSEFNQNPPKNMLLRKILIESETMPQSDYFPITTGITNSGCSSGAV